MTSGDYRRTMHHCRPADGPSARHRPESGTHLTSTQGHAGPRFGDLSDGDGRTSINSRNRRWLRWAETGRRVDDHRNGIESVEGSWHPSPTKSRHVSPASIAIRHPSPWITRNEGISQSRIPAPSAIHKRIKTRPRGERLPHQPVSGQVCVISVVVKIAQAIAIRP